MGMIKVEPKESNENFKHQPLKYLPELVQKIKNDPDVISLYLFGSHARGKTWNKSDIDLAVLLKEGFSPRKQFAKRLKLMALAASTLKTADVDLVIMNQSPTFLNYNIFREGQLLYESKAGKTQRVSFQARTYDAHFDYQPVAKIFRDAMIKRIEEGRYGG